jgi:2-amino-4-hydroxy-6-hydroxymethyldihydropteridine diphosphokinase
VTQVLVAAGSNVEPRANLRRALDALARHYPRLRCSSAYRNRAVGFEGEDFINLVIGFDTDDDVHTVIDRLHEAESLCGRARNAPKWAPRAMDLDILLYGDRTCDEPGLVLPRPDLLRRAYMLGPAAEVAPTMRHPVLGVTLEELWRDFPQDEHSLAAVPLDWPVPGQGA